MWNNAVGWWIVWFIAMQVVRSSGSGRVQRWILEYLYQPVPGYETVGWVLCRLFLIYAVSFTIILRIRDYFHRRKWKLFCVPYLARNKKKLTNYSSNDGYVQENNIVKCNDANRVLFTFCTVYSNDVRNKIHIGNLRLPRAIFSIYQNKNASSFHLTFTKPNTFCD